MSPGTTAPPSVVLFDIDDTLLAHREAVDLGITAHRATLDSGNPSTTDAVAGDTAEIARWYALEEKHYHRYLTGELDFVGQRRARAQEFVAAYGIELNPVEAERWYDEYAIEYRNAWALHDDAIPCLDGLGRVIPGVRFGLITNGELAYQRPKVATGGLDGYIEHLVASGEFAFTKPDERIFHHACALFETAPSSAAYVGDRLHTDAIGAARAGLAGVWLDRPGIATGEDLAEAAASGVSVIRTLDELPAVLIGR